MLEYVQQNCEYLTLFRKKTCTVCQIAIFVRRSWEVYNTVYTYLLLMGVSQYLVGLSRISGYGGSTIRTYIAWQGEFPSDFIWYISHLQGMGYVHTVNIR